MTAPLATPLILTADLAGSLNASAATLPAQLAKIIEESDRLQALASRRFDERIDTRYYTPTMNPNQMADTNGADLYLDDDLRSVTSLANGDGTAITTGYGLHPKNEPAKLIVRLNAYGTQYWNAGNADPVGSIAVTGLWGFGGQWIAAGTVSSGLAADAAAVSFTSSTALAAGMTLKIGAEYLYVNAIAGLVNTIDRAINGSIAAVHPDATAVYRWQADPLVQRFVKRLVTVGIEQDKSPLFGAVQVGEYIASTQPSDTKRAAIVADLEASGLMRELKITAV